MTDFNVKLFNSLKSSLSKEAFVPPPMPGQQQGMTAGGQMDPAQVAAYQQGMTPEYMALMSGQGAGPQTSPMPPADPTQQVPAQQQQQPQLQQQQASQEQPQAATTPAKKGKGPDPVQDKLIGDLLRRIVENASRIDGLEDKLAMILAPSAVKAGSALDGSLGLAIKNLLVDRK